MPSLRRHFLRLLVKYVVGPKFRRAGTSLSEWRELDEWIIRNQKIPPGVEVQPVKVNGLGAEWVRAANAQTDNAILYLHGGSFIIGSPATHRELAAHLSAATRARILSLDYRLYVFMYVGDQEILLSDSVRLAERAREANVEVELKIWPDLWHVFQTNARYLPEAR